MIIKGFSVPTRYTHKRFRNHIFRGDENVSIAVLQGTERDAQDFFDDAERDGKTFAVRHWIISPGSETTRKEMMDILRDLAREFGFNPSDAVVIEHEKPKFGEDVFDRHWHVLVPAWDRDGKGTVIDTSHDYARHEKISRLAEWRLGHRFIEGDHTPAVIAALKRGGHCKAALALAAAFPISEKRDVAFTHAEAQAAKRIGLNLSEVRSVVQVAWRSTLTIGQFEQELTEHGLKLAVGVRRPPAWVITDASGTTLMRVTKAAHVSKAEVRKRLGEPNGQREEENHEPVRTNDAGAGIVADFDEGNPRATGGDSSLATEPDGGKRHLDPEAFLKGLTIVADRIDVFAKQVERANTPKIVRLETALAKLEIEAQVKIDVAERFRLDESHVLESCRRDLDKAEAKLAALRLQRDAATAALKTLSAEAKPTIFGRKDYFRRLCDVENVVASAQEKVDVALVERGGAAKRVEYWLGVHDAKFEEEVAPLTTAAAEARKRLFTIRKARALAKSNPTFLRFGPLAVYQHAAARVEMEEYPQVTWTGAVDIWGIPIEPPRHRL